MAYTSTNRTTHTPAASGVASALFAVATRWRKYRMYRETLHELNSLSERELSDLGLNQSMIRSVAYRAAYDG